MSTQTPIIPTHPIPVSASAELEITKLFNARVRSYCADEIREFAMCAKNHYVSGGYTCRNQKIAMNTCLRQHGTTEERDRARQEWFQNKQRERMRREEQEREQQRLEDERIKALSQPGPGSWFGWFWNLTSSNGTSKGGKATS